MNINVNITNKRCTVQGAPVIVCGNFDYTMTFTFDAEWDSAAEKTARFSYVRDGVRRYKDVKLEGNTVAVPPVYGTKGLQVGVYSGDLVTSTPGRIPCEKSIICSTCTPEDMWPSTADALRKEIAETVSLAFAHIMSQIHPKIEATAQLVQCVPARGRSLGVGIFDPIIIGEDEDVDQCYKITVCGKNLYNIDAYPLKTRGYPNKTTGSFVSSDSYRQTDFIPVKHLQGQIITVNYAPVGAKYPGMAFYTRLPASTQADREAAYCGGDTGANTVVPANAEYMCFCVAAEYASKGVQLEIGSVATDFEAYHAETLTLTSEEVQYKRAYVDGSGQLVNIYASRHTVIDGVTTEAVVAYHTVEVSGSADTAGMIGVLTQKTNILTSTSLAAAVDKAAAVDGGAGA